jgi:predicted phosphodiesterase
LKIAIFADVHGNEPAFAAVLDDIERQQVDLIVCAGDAINPFPGSLQIWQQIQARHIPMVVGNHEEYVHTFHTARPEAGIQTDIRFGPLHFAARLFEPTVAAEIAALPKTLTIPGLAGDDVLICHASPENTRKSFQAGIDAALAAELGRYRESVIIGGHHHLQWRRAWQGKWLLLCGSVGLPLSGSPQAQYLLLSHQQGRWRFEHRTVPYDLPAALRQLVVSGFLAESGPIGWLFFDELATADYRLVPFFDQFCPPQKPATLAGWQALVQAYLKSIGRWAAVTRYLS